MYQVLVRYIPQSIPGLRILTHAPHSRPSSSTLGTADGVHAQQQTTTMGSAVSTGLSDETRVALERLPAAAQAELAHVAQTSGLLQPEAPAEGAQAAEAPAATAPAAAAGAGQAQGKQATQGTEASPGTSKWDEIGATSLKKALINTVMVDAAWLADLADHKGILPRCQELPESAKVSLAEMEAWGDEYTVGVLVISYPWLDKNHPDPHGEQLQQIAFVLKAFAAKAREYQGCRVGVFWEYPP